MIELNKKKPMILFAHAEHAGLGGTPTGAYNDAHTGNPQASNPDPSMAKWTGAEYDGVYSSSEMTGGANLNAGGAIQIGSTDNLLEYCNTINSELENLASTIAILRESSAAVRDAWASEVTTARDEFINPMLSSLNGLSGPATTGLQNFTTSINTFVENYIAALEQGK